MTTTKPVNTKQVRKLETAELKAVTGGVGPVHEVPTMKGLAKQIPRRNRKLEGRV